MFCRRFSTSDITNRLKKPGYTSLSVWPLLCSDIEDISKQGNHKLLQLVVAPPGFRELEVLVP